LGVPKPEESFAVLKGTADGEADFVFSKQTALVA
jgi:hypothetical protein